MGWVNLIALVRANPPTQKEKPAEHRATPRLHYVDSRTRAFDLHTQQRPLLSNVDSGKLLCSQARSVPMSPAGCGVGMHFLKQRVHCAEDHVPHLRVAGNGEVRCSLYDEVGDDRCVLRVFNADILTCQKHQNTPSVKYSNRLYITWHGGISDSNAVQQDG